MIPEQTVRAVRQNPIIHSFLEHRHLSPADLDYLLYPKASHQHDPFLLRGAGHWIDLLHSHKGDVIAVVPDYDADGVLSGTLARVGLYLLGFGDVYVYPPSSRDGYGLTRTSVDHVLTAQPNTQVLVTTDNGSNAADGIQYAKDKGLTVLVTDHHLSSIQTAADAAVNPNADSDNTYPFAEISGTAVIYKVLSAYMDKYITDPNIRARFQSLVLLVGISTISDMMPMLNENRYYVRRAVQMLSYFSVGHSLERAALYDDSPLGRFYRGVDLLLDTLDKHNRLRGGITPDTFGFVIGPLLNSSRRVTGESRFAFHLFCVQQGMLSSDGYVTPSDMLYDLNEQRKARVRVISAALADYLDQQSTPITRQAVFSARMGAGIAGLISGAFTQKYGLPSVAFSVPGAGDDLINPDVSGFQFLTGSARAPEGFDLHEMLAELDAEHPGVMLRWGGHTQAAGLTVDAAQYPAFCHAFADKVEARIQAITASAGSASTLPVAGEFVLSTNAYLQWARHAGMHAPGLCVPVNQTVWDAARFFDQLEPFGQGFQKPTFSVVINMRTATLFTMGADKQHAKLLLPNGVTVIFWNEARVFVRDDETAPDVRWFVATGALGINEYGGTESLQLIAKDFMELH